MRAVSRRAGRRFGARATTRSAAAAPVVPAFDPASLFGASDRGVIINNRDGVLYQLSGGTTAVTTAGEPIGYATDLSPNAKPALQATAGSRPIWAGSPRTVGSELAVNGQMATDSDWTKGTGWTIGSGVATKAAGSASVLAQAITLTPGKFYQIHFVITRSAGTVLARFTGGTTVSGISRNAAGSYTDVLLAVTGNTTLEFSADATFAGTVDRVTIKEVLTFSNMGALFDGVDDFMQTASIDMTASDKLTIVASCQIGQSALAQTIVAQGNYLANLTGSTEAIASGGLSARLRGDTASATSAAGGTEANSALAPQSNVLCASFDIAGASIAAEASMRVRGTLPTQSTSGTTTGGGVFANSPITLAKGFQGSSRLGGFIYRVIVINRTLTAGEIADAEAWCKAGMAYCAVLGDSTVTRLSSAASLPNAMPVSSVVGGIVVNAADISHSGDRIADQKTLWTALANKSAFQAVFIQVGQNDVKGRVGASPATATSAQVIADYQDLVDTVRAGVSASCKIYACGISPSKAWIDLAPNAAASYQAWLDLNAAIAGTHTTNITGVDGRITSHVALMNDGSGNLAAQYDYNNDGVHPGNAGRFLVGQAWRTQLEADGLV